MTSVLLDGPLCDWELFLEHKPVVRLSLRLAGTSLAEERGRPLAATQSPSAQSDVALRRVFRLETNRPELKWSARGVKHSNENALSTLDRSCLLIRIRADRSLATHRDKTTCFVDNALNKLGTSGCEFNQPANITI